MPLHRILWLEYSVIGLVGAMIGSFLNVVIYRVPKGESLVFPGSHCPDCNRAIRPWENIPILSFLILRGKCAGCRKQISSQYPIVEAANGLLMIAMLTKFDWTWDLLLYAIFASVLLALAVIDIQTLRLPNAINLFGAITGLAAALIIHPDEWMKPLLGGLVGGGLLVLMGLIGNLIFQKETLGGGDVKLAAMMGIFLGPALTAGMFVFGVFVGALVGGVLLLVSGGGWGKKIPFGPYLAAGGLVSLFWGEALWKWYIHLALR